MKGQFRILFLVRKTRVSQKGVAPIRVRITMNGKSVEFSSGASISPNIWDAKSGKATGRTLEATETNAVIEKIITRLHTKYREIDEKLGYVTPELLRNSFFGKEEKATTLLNLFDKKIEEKEALSEISIGQDTVEKYENARKKLKGFILDYCKSPDIPIKEVNKDFIINFDIYLRSKSKLSHNTVVKELRYLKQITTGAFKSGLIRIDPFMDFPLSSRMGYREYLTKEELRIMINRRFGSETLKEIRDVFVFQCFTGFSYIDVFNLTEGDIITRENNKKFIIKKRTKSKVKAFVPLLETPLKILRKYQKQHLPAKKLLPVKDCQVMNRCLKEIAELCGIKKSLSTHCGRHTCATLLLTEGLSIESVSKILGHTDIRTTQIYARILNEKVISELSDKEQRLDSLSDLREE